MFALEPPIDPPIDFWKDYGKRQLIESTVREMCRSIAEKGEKSIFDDIFNYLCEHVEDNIEKYLPEEAYE